MNLRNRVTLSLNLLYKIVKLMFVYFTARIVNNLVIESLPVKSVDDRLLIIGHVLSNRVYEVLSGPVHFQRSIVVIVRIVGFRLRN